MPTIRELFVTLGVHADNKALKDYDQGLKQVKSTMKAVAIVGGVVTAALWQISKAGDAAEVTMVSFTTMLGNQADALKLVADMKALALETPFSFPEVEQNVKMLLAMGSSAGMVLNELKLMGDVSAGLNVPIGRLALNFGQVRTMGRLMGRELRDFSVAGVPLLETLAKQMGKTKTEVKEMVTAGEVSFDDVKGAFISMTSEGGRFANLMEKMALTSKGLKSNLGVMFSLALRDLGKILNEYLKPILKKMFEWAKSVKNLKESMKTLAKWALYVGAAFATWAIGSMLSGLIFMIMGVVGAVKTLGIVALISNSKLLLIPLLLGAGFLAVSAMFEDFYKTITQPTAKTIFGTWRSEIMAVRDELQKLENFLMGKGYKTNKQLGGLMTTTSSIGGAGNGQNILGSGGLGPAAHQSAMSMADAIERHFRNSSVGRFFAPSTVPYNRNALGAGQGSTDNRNSGNTTQNITLVNPSTPQVEFFTGADMGEN